MGVGGGVEVEWGGWWGEGREEGSFGGLGEGGGRQGMLRKGSAREEARFESFPIFRGGLREV